ncbi:hypothetical protein UlMin_030199 [Ulmus minor]
MKRPWEEEHEEEQSKKMRSSSVKLELWSRIPGEKPLLQTPIELEASLFQKYFAKPQFRVEAQENGRMVSVIRDLDASINLRRGKRSIKIDVDMLKLLEKRKITQKNGGTRKNINVKQEGPNPPPPMPDCLKQHIYITMRVKDAKLVIQKRLYASDLNQLQNRLSIPIKQIRCNNFLNEEEKRTLDEMEENGKNCKGIDVIFIEPCFEKTRMVLKKWRYTNSSSYALNNNWIHIAKKNNMKEGDIVQVWFFRNCNDKLCFALVNLDQVKEEEEDFSQQNSEIV